MKVSIIIVSWNVRQTLCDCIDSIRRFPSRHGCEIIVVDNASHDGTAEYIRQHYPDIILVANKHNMGFGRANNQGAAFASGEYIFILNPDTLLLENSIDPLVDFMDSHQDIAISGPRVLNADGSTQRSVRKFQTWKAAFNKYTPLRLFGIFKADMADWRCREFNYGQQANVEQLIGAALMVRRSVFNSLNGFDERFFMYYEEVDLCYRTWASGYRNVYCPFARLVHIGGKSSSQIPAKRQFMILQSLVRYLRKHTPSARAEILSVLLKIGVFTMQLYDVIANFVGYLLAQLIRNNRKASKYKDRYKAALEFLTCYSLEFFRA